MLPSLSLSLCSLLPILALPLLPLTSAWTSSGCLNPTPRAQLGLDSDGHMTRTVEGGRTYLLHVPEGYDGGTALSAVLSYHGAGGTSAKQETLSQFSSPTLRIAQLPVIAAYPQGASNAAENRTGVWYSAPYYNTTVDDVQFTKDILTDLASLLCINLHRFYAAGKSNGGGFVSYLACRSDTAGLFAAFASASPALYPESLAFTGVGGVDNGQPACDPGRAVPIINSHGEQDQTIPYLGRNDTAPPKGSGLYGEGTSTINVPQYRRLWATRNGCASEEPDVTQYLYNGTTVQKWTATQGCKAEFVAYTTDYLGHSWPTTGGLDASGAPNNTARFNYTDPAVASFFTENWLAEEYVIKNWS